MTIEDKPVNIMATNQTTGISVNLSTGEVNAGTVQFRNRIINGDMRIDQRNAGTAVSLTFNSGGYYIDQFRTNSTSFTAGSATIQRVADAPSGFINSYKITIGATPFSGGTNPYTFGVYQNIESYNLNDFKLGTVNASPFTISFWFKANNAGEYALTFIGYNPPTYSRYTTTFTVQANIWTFVTKLIPSTGALTGTWNSTNDIGLQVAIASYQGTAGNASALNTWGSGNVNSATSLNWPSIANATIQVTGVQLEKGSKATPFEFRPYTLELQLCQRYFAKTYEPETTPGSSSAYSGALKTTGLAVTGTISQNHPIAANTVWFFPVQMRAVPTCIVYSPVTGVINKYCIDTTDFDAGTTSLQGNTTTGLNPSRTYAIPTHTNVAARTSVAGNIHHCHMTASAEL